MNRGTKVKQQQRVVLLALYLLKHIFGHNTPEKKQVLNFIQFRDLMNIPKEDLDTRDSGEAIWRNDLAWKRQDLKDNGFITKPENGKWQLTSAGEENVRMWAVKVKERSEKVPDWEAEFTPDVEEDIYITKEVVRWARSINDNRLKETAQNVGILPR
jgi:restriction endonuclease Mrr